MSHKLEMKLKKKKGVKPCIFMLLPSIKPLLTLQQYSHKAIDNKVFQSYLAYCMKMVRGAATPKVPMKTNFVYQ